MRDREAIFADLAKPLPAGLVATRRESGKELSYIEGFDAINQANKVFGFDGWGSEVIDIDYREVTRGEQVTGIYMARIRITVEGWPAKMDVGVGLTAGFSPQAHETAMKAAVTDGIKRTLRQFGNQFGNSLYDKENPLGEEQPPADPRTPAQRQQPRQGGAGGPTPAQRQTIKGLLGELGWKVRQLADYTQDRYRVDPDKLAVEQAAEVIDWLRTQQTQQRTLQRGE